jgi:hypothetical protein
MIYARRTRRAPEKAPRTTGELHPGRHDQHPFLVNGKDVAVTTPMRNTPLVRSRKPTSSSTLAYHSGAPRRRRRRQERQGGLRLRATTSRNIVTHEEPFFGLGETHDRTRWHRCTSLVVAVPDPQA